MTQALVIGAGPAGLMAAERLSARGVAVTIAEAKPSVGRKFLMAGKSGLNLTKDEPSERFLSAYGQAAIHLKPMLDTLGPTEVQDWAKALGQDLFTGSTGRVFPSAMKASPLLRAWLAGLTAQGVEIRTRTRWMGWDRALTFDFETPDGPWRATPDLAVLACGGASWARLGSDGAWAAQIPDGDLAPFQPSNAAIAVEWSDHMAQHLGSPIKAVKWTCGAETSRGEAVLSRGGLEGGGVYALTPAVRAGARLELDLLPGLSAEQIVTRLQKPRGKASLSNHLRKVLGLSPVKLALLRECAGPLSKFPEVLAQVIKALPVPYTGLRPMDEAISTAGGVRFQALDTRLMLQEHPNVYCAGEMLDWEAPTGGYLITACLATGAWVGENATI